MTSDSIDVSRGETAPLAREASRSVVLDLLRFLAAALVVVFHYQSEGPWPLSRLTPVFLRGYIATDFFLILSGYVLGRAYGRKVLQGAVSDGRFLVKRVLRVWPAHLAMLAAFVVVVLVSTVLGLAAHDAEQFQWRDLLGQALLIHAWGLDTGSGWNLPTWSLSALVVCYAAFPALWRQLSRVRSGAVLFLGGLALVWGANLLSRELYGQALYDLSFNMGVLRALPLFAFGTCIARASELDGAPRRGMGWLALAAGVLVVGLQSFGRFDLISLALLGLLIGAGGAVRSKHGVAVSAQAGRIAFALYITHIFVAMIWFHAVRSLVAHLHPSQSVQWVLWALALPLAVATAVAFERFVDRPLQRAVGRWLGERRERRAVPRPGQPFYG